MKIRVTINVLTLLGIVIDPFKLKSINCKKITKVGHVNQSYIKDASVTENNKPTKSQVGVPITKYPNTSETSKVLRKTKKQVSKKTNSSHKRTFKAFNKLGAEVVMNKPSTLDVDSKQNHSSVKKINKQPTFESKKKTVSKSKRSKKRGKVFADSKEEILHLRLIDNMMFKPLESNNSVSISFSDTEEITNDNIKQAIEERDGSYVALRVKRKKDIYKEFIRWAHNHEKNERRKKIQQEVFEKYKTAFINLPKSSINSLPEPLNNVSYQMNNDSNKTRVTNQITKPLCNSVNDTDYRENKYGFGYSLLNKTSNHTLKTTDRGEQSKKPKEPFNTSSKPEEKYFKAESVEFQYDPSYLHQLYASAKKQKRKSRQERTTTVKTYYEGRIDISAEDYSAQEEFMLHTQKEAMGRRFYQMFENKTARDFWNNETLETTKMLDILLPLGKHLHEALDKLPPNEGMHFMTNLQMYKRELEKFIALVKRDKAETRNDVVELLEEPYDHVCETKYCEDEVKIMFNWDDKEYEIFEKLLEETREIWFDLQLFHHCYQFVSDSPESISTSYNCSIEQVQNTTRKL